MATRSAGSPRSSPASAAATASSASRAAWDGGEADVVLGRDFLVDAELAARVERIPGVAAVRLSVAEPPRLALVS